MLPSVPASSRALAALFAAVLLAALAAPSLGAAAAGGIALEQEGDRAFESRASGTSSAWALDGPIESAVSAYTAALEQRPDDLGLRVKLLRALFFQAEYVSQAEDRRKELYSRGTDLFEESFALLARHVGVRSLRGVRGESLRGRLGQIDEAGPLYFWGAMHWGLWAESFGKIAAIRQGVLKKVRELGEGAVVLAPTYESYGPLRIVGRLHHLTPKIPVYSGWVDRRHAVRMLQQSADAEPLEPLNRTFLAHALWELAGNHGAALDLLWSVVGSTPRASHQVEDLRAIEGARDLIRLVESDARKHGARASSRVQRSTPAGR